MIKISDIFGKLCICITLLHVGNVQSKEYLLEADVDTRVEYNSNIFLTTLPHESVQGVVITPSLSGVIKEQHWESELSARIKSYNYSDSNFNSNDQYFDLTGRYLEERNIFSLNVNYDLASNLNSTSSDFGIVGQRVNTKSQSISPRYTRLLTERTALVLSYTYTDVGYLEAENTGFTPYVSETASGTLIYDLTERDKFTISLNAVDYSSQNKLVTYQLFMSRMGIEHEFSETLSTDFLIGVSRRNSTNLQSESFDFFGQPITVVQEIDFEDRGFVLDAGIKQLLENGKIEGRISRDNTTNSFGGLDQVDKFEASYDNKISSLWNYSISARFEDIVSLSSGTRTTNRDILFFETKFYYKISRNWISNASYRYVQRKFKSDTSEDRAPHSNRFYVGLTYNFPSLSTF